MKNDYAETWHRLKIENIGNSISIKELKDLEIALLKDPKPQGELVKDYEEEQKKCLQSLHDLKSLKSSILDNNFVKED